MEAQADAGADSHADVLEALEELKQVLLSIEEPESFQFEAEGGEGSAASAVSMLAGAIPTVAKHVKRFFKTRNKDAVYHLTITELLELVDEYLKEENKSPTEALRILKEQEMSGKDLSDMSKAKLEDLLNGCSQGVIKALQRLVRDDNALTKNFYIWLKTKTGPKKLK